MTPVSTGVPIMDWAQSSFTLKVDFSTSHNSVPSPRCQTSRLWGFAGKIHPPRSPTVPSHLHFEGYRSVFPLDISHWAMEDFGASPCGEKKGQECFGDGGQKSFAIMPGPQRHGLVFPLCSLEWNVDFSSFLLTPTSPPSSWLLAVPALTSRDNSQNRILLLQQWNIATVWHPSVPQSPDPWLGPRGFVVGC